MAYFCLIAPPRCSLPNVAKINAWGDILGWTLQGDLGLWTSPTMWPVRSCQHGCHSYPSWLVRRPRRRTVLKCKGLGEFCKHVQKRHQTNIRQTVQQQNARLSVSYFDICCWKGSKWDDVRSHFSVPALGFEQNMICRTIGPPIGKIWKNVFLQILQMQQCIAAAWFFPSVGLLLFYPPCTGLFTYFISWSFTSKIR